MNCFSCPRCGFEGLERKFSVCAGCNYGLETDSQGEVPIPSWALQFLDPTPLELEEIKEINFGIPPIRIPAPKKRVEAVTSAPAEIPTDSKRKTESAVPLLRTVSAGERHHRFPVVATGQCVA